MIRGKNINLRTFRDSDIEPFQKINNELQNRGDYFPLDLEPDVGFRNWYNENGLWDENFGRLLICNNQDEILGCINYFKTVGYFEALEIGYILYDETQRGKGITTEALSLFTNYLFKAKKITRLEIRCNPKNISSKRVAEKCGYLFEGINRGFARKAGELLDIELYAMTIEDWKQRDYN